MLFLLFPGLPLVALAGLVGYFSIYGVARFLPGGISHALATFLWCAPAAFLLFKWATYLLAGERTMEELGLAPATIFIVGWSLGGLLGSTIGRDAHQSE